MVQFIDDKATFLYKCIKSIIWKFHNSPNKCCRPRQLCTRSGYCLNLTRCRKMSEFFSTLIRMAKISLAWSKLLLRLCKILADHGNFKPSLVFCNSRKATMHTATILSKVNTVITPATELQNQSRLVFTFMFRASKHFVETILK